MKFNTKDLNISAWIVIVLTYALPYQSTDGVATNFGYPISFLTVYNKPVSSTLMMSYYLNAMGFVVNILIVYLIIWFIKFIKTKYRKNRERT